MKKSLPLLLAFLFLMISVPISAQVNKLRTTSMAFRLQEKDGTWKEWGELKDASLLITIDENIERIIIYSTEKQVFDIAEYEGKTVDKDGDDVFSFYCVDNDGDVCRLKFITLNSRNKQKQLYIYYNEFSVLYNVIPLD